MSSSGLLKRISDSRASCGGLGRGWSRDLAPSSRTGPAPCSPLRSGAHSPLPEPARMPPSLLGWAKEATMP